MQILAMNQLTGKVFCDKITVDKWLFFRVLCMKFGLSAGLVCKKTDHTFGKKRINIEVKT